MTQVVRVPLASNVLYVSGTVNEVDKVWTREEGNWWSTVADKSTDGVYRVVLSIVYGDGKSTQDSVTLYYGLILVTDRTLQDVVNMTDKGFYNASDMNRVGAAMVYLRDKFNSNGYNVFVNPKLDWKGNETSGDIIYTDDEAIYLGCLSNIKSVLALPEYTPELPATLASLTYAKANDVEKMLEIVDKMLTNSLAFVYYSNDLFCGEVI